MTIDFHISALWSWLNFLAFTVLPIAFRELLHWLYEWQILLTGILALIAARVWGRSQNVSTTRPPPASTSPELLHPRPRSSCRQA